MKGRYYKVVKLSTIRDLVKRSAKLYTDKIAFRELDEKKNIIDHTFNELDKDIDALGTSLVSMGMKGYHIAIIGENSYYWVVSYLAVINGVGVVVPLDKELTDNDIKNLLIKSDADAIIFSTAYYEAVIKAFPECPCLKECIVMDQGDGYEGLDSIQSRIEVGNQLLEAGNSEFADCEIDTEIMSEIVFTSGTTGANKGVMLSHKNIMTVVFGAMSLMLVKNTSISVLPLSHTYECSCHLLGGIYSGLTICFNDSLKRVIENMKLFKPNLSIMVPLFLESMYRNIWLHAKREGLDKHLKYGIFISNILRKIGLDFRRFYFKPVLDNFGGELNQIICGGAPLRNEIIKGFSDIGIEVINGYGISECGPLVSANSVLRKRIGSVGRVIPGCSVKILNPDDKGIGEIAVKGDNVMLGYYKDMVNTRQTFTDDGWFMTGDIGYMDRRSFLYICGRKKILIILSNGKNVHPEEIEQAIIENIACVKEVIVYADTSGDGSNESINACIYVDDEYIKMLGIEDVKTKLENDIKQLNRSLSVYKRITNVIIKESEFEKTTTRKIKRLPLVEYAERSVENA